MWEFSISEENVENTGVQVISAQVAVKVMDNQRTTEDRIKFLQEVVLLGQFTDPNIVAVFGVVTTADKVFVKEIGLVKVNCIFISANDDL